VTQDHKVHLVSRVSRELLGLKERQVPRVFSATPETRVHREQSVSSDLKEYPEILDRSVLSDPRDKMGLRDSLDRLGQRVSLDKLVVRGLEECQAQLDQLDQLVPEVMLDLRGHLAIQEQLEQLGRREQVGQLDPLVMWGLLASSAHRVLQELLG
jgi:hypothetical protein